MNQKPDHPFAILARDVLPEQTSGRLARMADVNQRIAQRWLSGDLEAPADIVAMLEHQREILTSFHPGGELMKLLQTAHARGLHNEVTGSLVAGAYETLLQRRIK